MSNTRKLREGHCGKFVRPRRLWTGRIRGGASQAHSRAGMQHITEMMAQHMGGGGVGAQVKAMFSAHRRAGGS